MMTSARCFVPFILLLAFSPVPASAQQPWRKYNLAPGPNRTQVSGLPPTAPTMSDSCPFRNQYPKAWLAVDMRDGAVPPSTVRPLNDVLAGLKRPVIVIVSRSPEHEEWPQWFLHE